MPSSEAPPAVSAKEVASRFWFALLPAVFVLLVYLPALRYDLAWDDTIFLRDMPAYRDPSLWLSSIFRPFVLSPNYFRPLALLTFVLEIRLAGLSPALFHGSNILLHALNTALLSALVLQLLRRFPPPPAVQTQSQCLLSLFAGLLYGLHPALIEGVAFISSRFDLLMLSFLLAALLLDITIERRWLRPLAVGVTFLLAALAKEMAVAFALALPCWHLAQCPRPNGAESKGRRWPYLWRQARQRGDLWVYLAVLAAGLLYLGFRYLSLGYLLTPVPEATLPVGSLLQRLLLLARSLAGYVLLVFWPFTTLSPIHFAERPIPLSDPLAWVSLGVVVLALAAFVLLLRRTSRAGWLVLAGFLALLPVSNLLTLELGGGSFIAERYLLFPLALLVMAVVLLLAPLYEHLSSWDRYAWKLALPLLWLAASLAVIQLTLPHWREDLSLWTWAARRAPHSATPPANLSLQYINRGQYERGLQFAQQAIDLDPQSGNAWDNAGLALFYLERYDEAQAAFERAVELEPNSALYWNNLAGALREQGQLAEAERILLDRVLQVDPYHPAAHLNLGIVYMRADRPDLAQVHLQEAARLLPPEEVATALALLEETRQPERWLRLGDLLLANGQPDGAARAFERAGTLGAPAADVAAGLSAALIQMGNWDAAAQVLIQALEAAPEDARLYNNLGIVAREQGDLEGAQALFQRAIELAPEWELPQQNLQALPEE